MSSLFNNHFVATRTLPPFRMMDWVSFVLKLIPVTNWASVVNVTQLKHMDILILLRVTARVQGHRTIPELYVMVRYSLVAADTGIDFSQHLTSNCVQASASIANLTAEGQIFPRRSPGVVVLFVIAHCLIPLWLVVIKAVKEKGGVWWLVSTPPFLSETLLVLGGSEHRELFVTLKGFPNSVTVQGPIEVGAIRCHTLKLLT